MRRVNDHRGAPSGRPDRGAALIFALGILALLAMLISAFAILTGVETSAATNYREGERARTLAKSGLERAQAELRRAVTTPGYPLPWLVYDQYDYAAKRMGPDPGTLVAASLLDVGDGATRSPSLGMFLEPTPKALADHPTLPWPSGVLGGSYYQDPENPSFRGDYYVLRITDASAQIHLNDDNPHLPSMLDDLIAAIPGATPHDGLGQKLIAARPRSGFRRLDELAAVPGLSEDERATLTLMRPFLTCVARVDAKVVEAGQQEGRRSRLALQPRAPINVNLAPVPVLIAALAGVGHGTTKLGRERAALLASAIVRYRANPAISDDPSVSPNTTGTPASRRWGFQRWGELKLFLEDPAWGALDPSMAAAVLANANPNTDLAKFVPDACLDRVLDKSDLASATTELCFAPGGVFTIESLGVVLGPDGLPVATAKARSVVRAFERYVETTQADFESGRVDPPGYGANRGLRDIVSLPESRNAFDAVIQGDLAKDELAPASHAGMHAGDYDGQLTFNVITSTPLHRDAFYAGFIDRTLDGLLLKSSDRAAPGGQDPTQVGRPMARTNNDNQILGYVLDAGNPTNSDPAKRLQPPSFDDGSDYHPLGAYVGRKDRVLAYDQDAAVKGELLRAPDFAVTIPVHQDVRATNGAHLGTVDFKVSENATNWDYEPILNQSFEFWFKPARRQDAAFEVVLFDWQAGGAKHPDVRLEDTMSDYSAVADPTNGGSTTVGRGPGGKVTFNPATYNNTVPTTVPHPSHQREVTWGAGARFTVWLQADGPGDTYTLHAKFAINKPDDETSRFKPQPNGYVKEWVYPSPNATGGGGGIRPGTWHHVLVSWESPTSIDPAELQKEHSFLFVDGRHQSVEHEPEWPTEIGLRGQLIRVAIQNLGAYIRQVIAAEAAATPAIAPGSYDDSSLSSYDADVEQYRQAAVLGNGDFVWLGAVTPKPEPDCPFADLATAPGFVGIMDNFVVHNHFARQIGSGELEDGVFLRRYDTYRPSAGAPPGDRPLVFTKRTPALDWGRPVRVIAYDVTAWKQNRAGGADVDAVDPGLVFFRFGWLDRATPLEEPSGTAPLGLPPLDGAYDPLAAPQGWTKRLNGTSPWNAVANGFLVPGRDTGGGFLTKGPGEYTLYAVELLPFKNDGTGPRMAPVVDDVTVVYTRWDAGTTIEEEEVVDPD